MKRTITIAVFFVLFSQVCDGQWRLVKQFNLPEKYYVGKLRQIATIRFIKFNQWGVGFAGTSPGPENIKGGLWKTLDSGATWEQMQINESPKLDKLFSTDITFKDSLTGWMTTTYGPYTPSAAMVVIKTTDGGTKWDVVFADGGMESYAIYYAPHINVLFATLWIPRGLWCSKDEGKTWNNVSSNGPNGFTGNDSVIIAGGIGFPLIRSSDKGLTWQDVYMPGLPNYPQVDCWQPYCDNRRKLCFNVQQGDPNSQSPAAFFASTDFGETWALKHKFDFSYYLDFDSHGGFDNTKGEAPNACISGDDAGNVYLQMLNGGIWRSADTGATWTSICGPSNKWDTRFTIFNNTIFAGDTNGIWALDLLTPQGIQIPTSVPIVGSDCNTSRSALYFSSSYYCAGSVVLDSISSGGSSAFTLMPNYRRGVVSGKDSVFVDYVPQSSSDTGYVVFHFTENGIRRDTVVTVIGKIVSPHLDITLTPQLIENNLIAGKEAECNVISSNRIQDRGLDKVTFDLTYDNDLLEVAEITAQAGMSATYTAPIVTNGIARLPISITGNNMTIDSLLPMVSVKFRTFLTDTTLSTIELSTIQLNDDDPNYKNCTLSATGNRTTFTQASICGDSTIRSFMMTGKLIDILSIRPNPTNADATVSFESFTNDKAHLQLLDELGKVVLEESVVTKQGMNDHTIAIPKHWSGTFYLRLQIGKDVVTGKFVKQ